jgi:hypothetical protein
MSQFDHESDDQSAAANALVRDLKMPLDERAAFIVENAREIYVRVRIGDRFENYPLSELRGVMAISEAFRLLLHEGGPR